MIQEVLAKFGLTEKETKIYLTLLELGPSFASTIKRKTGLPRTTVYTLLESLKQKGIISHFIKNKTTYFSALDPEVLVERAKERIVDAKMIEKGLEAILPDLKNLSSTFATKPKLFFFEGIEGIKSLYEDTLDCEDEMLRIFVTVEHLPEELEDYLRKDYIEKRLKKGIKTRAIVSQSKVASRYQKLDKKSLRESKILPDGSLPFESEICLYGKNKIAIITFKDDLVGFRIENEALFDTLQSIFCTFWKIYLPK